jgi:hypothetical protein
VEGKSDTATLMVFSDHDGIRLSRYYTPSLTSATTMTSFFLNLFGTFKKTCNRDVRLRKPFTTEKSKTTDYPDEDGYEEMTTARLLTAICKIRG